MKLFQKNFEKKISNLFLLLIKSLIFKYEIQNILYIAYLLFISKENEIIFIYI